MASRFTNLDGSKPQSFGSVMKWAVVDRVSGKRRIIKTGTPAPRVEPDRALIAKAPAVGEPARLTWLGHASWLVQLDGISLVVDPVLGPHISGVVQRHVAPGLRADELPELTASLVTHNHRDHLDLPSLRAAKARVIAGTGTRPVFRGTGLEVYELAWWEEREVGGVKVTFVASQHWSRRGAFDENQMLWGGFVITGSRSCVYHSGDTAWFEGFKEIGRRFPHITSALLPIGAYDPAWFMEKQHMNPEQAVAAFVDLNARDFYAMHWGTFQLTDEALDEPPRRLAAEWTRRALEPSRLHILAVGETRNG